MNGADKDLAAPASRRETGESDGGLAWLCRFVMGSSVGGGRGNTNEKSRPVQGGF